LGRAARTDREGPRAFSVCAVEAWRERRPQGTPQPDGGLLSKAVPPSCLLTPEEGKLVTVLGALRGQGAEALLIELL
jgi:hypothetical protein